MRDKSVLFLFHFPEKEFGKSGRIVTKLSAYRKKLLSRCVPVVQLTGDVNFFCGPVRAVQMQPHI
jgi:hypothetical protein